MTVFRRKGFKKDPKYQNKTAIFYIAQHTCTAFSLKEILAENLYTFFQRIACGFVRFFAADRTAAAPVVYFFAV